MGGGQQHRLDIFDKYALHLKVFPLSVSGYTVQDISCGLTVTYVTSPLKESHLGSFNELSVL